jgi:nickel-type superoxide dismutase maturation protease
VPDLLPLRRFRVADTSMQPALQPGEHVLVATWLGPRVGDIVVLHDPEWSLTYTVKRVVGVTSNGLDVRGDNVNVSRDSRHFGSVPRRLVIGRVVYRYLPAQSRGRL